MGFLIPIFTAIVSIGTAVVAAIVAAGPIAIIAATIAVAAVVAYVVTPFLTPDYGDMGAGGAMGDSQSIQQGVLVTRTGSDQSIPVIYGYRKAGGIITFAETGNTDNKYLYVAYVFCEGAVEGIQDLFIQDFQMPSSIIQELNAGKIVNVSEGKYAGRAKLQFFQGQYFSNAANSTVGSESILGDAPSWSVDMNYNGLAVMFARFEWKAVETQEDSDNNPFGGSIPELQATILGKKIADATSPNASGYTYDVAPVRYSSNPVDHLMDYLRNPRYGKGLRNSDFDWESFRKSALKCNTVVQYVDSGTSGPILTSNIVIDTGQKLLTNVKSMLSGFRAYMPDVAGKYKLKIEDAGDPDDILSGVATIVNTFDEDNIVGNIVYTGIERSAKYTSVKVGYIDPDKKWSRAEVVYPESAAARQVYINEDNGRINQGETSFIGLTNYAIAKDMARLIFNKSRYQESCSITVSSEGIELEPGDNVYIQSKLLNFGTIPWRVISISINADMTVDLACVRNKDDIYPHTRVGEEDIVLPPYIPRRAQIYYPAVQSTIPVGLVPPTHATVPRIHSAPFINAVTPTTFSSAGTNQVNILGGNYYNGVNVLFIGNDGTEYQPTSVSRLSNGLIETGTLASMTSGNQPYDVQVINNGDNGSLTTTKFNVITVNNIPPVSDVPDIVDPPIIVDPNLLAPPEVSDHTPKFAASAGVTPITITGNYFRPGIEAYFFGKDGTKYNAVSVTRNSQRSLTISSIGTMTSSNQPYSIYLVNDSEYGSYDVLITNSFNVDGTNPPSVTDPSNNPIVQVPRSVPRIDSASPLQVVDATETVVTLYAGNIYPGVTAIWVGNDGTTYAPAGQERLDINSYRITTNSGMTNANEPYGIRMTQRPEFGATQILQNNLVNVDDNTVVPPPVIEVPEDPYIPPVTPNPTDPPSDGDTPNDPPTDPGEAKGGDDTIDITNIDYNFHSDGLVNVTLSFAQPSNAMYEKVKGYVKRNTSDFYQDFEIRSRPGPGNIITHSIENLFADSEYEIITRVVYNDNSGSSKVATIKVTTTASAAEAGGDPVEYVTAAAGGWPSDSVISSKARDNRMGIKRGAFILAGGVPSSPRRMTITFLQDFYTGNPNADITGVKVYSKTTTATKWQSDFVLFPDNYAPGTEVTVECPAPLGFPTYPAVPTSAQQDVDFIFRWLYKGGEESTSQQRITLQVEYNTGVYNFDPFYGKSGRHEHSSEYYFELADLSAPAASANIFMNLTDVTPLNSRGTNEMQVYMTPPDNSVIADWAGVRFRSRPVQPGADPEFETYTQTSVKVNPVSGIAYYIVPTIFEQDREWIITPLYRDPSTGERVDSTESWFGSGYISDRTSGRDIPSTGIRWYNKFNWRRMKTAEALKTIDLAFPAPANPAVDITGFYTNSNGDQYGGYWAWAEITFDHRKVANYTGIDIYRRKNKSAQFTNSSNFRHLNTWEKVQYNTVNNSGSQTIILRAALEDSRNGYFNPAAAVSSSNAVFQSYAKRGPSYYYVDTKSVEYTEFLIVTRTTAGTSTVAMHLQPALGNRFNTVKRDELAGSRADEVLLTNYTGVHLTALELNLEQAHTGVTTNELVTNVWRLTPYTIPAYFDVWQASDVL